MGTRDTAKKVAAIAECVRLEREVAARDAVITEVRSICKDDWINLANSTDSYLARRFTLVVPTEDILAALDAAPESTLSRVILGAKAEALIEFADANRIPFVMFEWTIPETGERYPVTVNDLLRSQASEYRTEAGK